MKKKAYREMGSLVLLTAVILVWAFAVTCGGGGDGGSSSTGSTGTVNTSISDPPTCKADFSNVWVTITRVRAHKSPNADSNDSGWVDLLDLRDKPQQIDLLSLDSDNCILTMLGSTSGIPAGQYQQIRLYLLSNSPASTEKTPLPNRCEGSGFNCVALSGGGTETLQLSSEAQTGIKIPSGQIAGGRFTVPAGQAMDLNLDFDACSSIVRQGNGQFRLKPVLHAGEISLITNAAISGRVIENGNPNAPIENAIVLIEQKDSENIDRVIMQKLTDPDGKFIFCPLPSGAYDVVIGGKNSAAIYIPTITLGVGVGAAMGNISLLRAPELAANINGQVTAQITSPGKEVDIDISALQNADASLRVTVPVLQGSTPTTVTTVSGTANYSLSVPVGNPQVGPFSSAGTSYIQVSGEYLINAQASNCTQSSLLTSPLTVSPGGNSSAQVIAFTGCSGN